MKIPNDETPDNSTSNGDGYTSDDFDHLDHIEMPPPPIRDGDFSEYMWMENEEEFNSQVLRELEEQELMEECMAAMLGDSPSEESESQSGENNHSGSNSRTSTDSYSTSFNVLSESVNNLSLSSNGVRNNSSDSFNNSHSQSSSNFSAQSRLNRIRSLDNNRSNSAAENGSKSTLNPDAKEFVPSSPRAATTLSNSEEEEVPS